MSGKVIKPEQWQPELLNKTQEVLPTLKSYISALTRDPDLTDDVLQETLLRTNRSANIQELHNPLAYMITVAKTVVFDYQRKMIPSAPDVDADSLTAANDSLEVEQLNTQKLCAIQRILDDMPELRRKVFVLRRLHGLSREQIAAQLDLSVEAVKKHVTRAMVDITLKMEEQGWDSAL